MTPSQARFYDLLDKYPRLVPYWDKEDRIFKEELAEASFVALSSGEKVALTLLASIWLHKNWNAPGYNIGFIDIPENRTYLQPLLDWVNDPDPCWP